MSASVPGTLIAPLAMTASMPPLACGLMLLLVLKCGRAEVQVAVGVDLMKG